MENNMKKNRQKVITQKTKIVAKTKINFCDTPVLVNATQTKSQYILSKKYLKDFSQKIHRGFLALADYVSPIPTVDEDQPQLPTKIISISTLQIIVIFLCVILIVMPFVSTFNEFITRIVMRIEAYKFIQNIIVPYEVKIVSGLLNAIGIESQSSLTRINMMKGNTPIDIFISWNCIGWQSFILFMLSAFVGLKGPFTVASKIEVIMVGIMGTLLINIFRISFIAIIAYYFGELSAVIFHDYVSTIMVIIWLITYWTFAHQFLLHHLDFVKIKAMNHL